MAPGVAPLTQAPRHSSKATAPGLASAKGLNDTKLMRISTLYAPVVAMALVACGARQPQLQAEETALDSQLSCAHLQGERATNGSRISELGRESDGRHAANVGMVLLTGVAGLMFVDNGETQRLEVAALERRNARLQTLAAARSCGP